KNDPQRSTPLKGRDRLLALTSYQSKAGKSPRLAPASRIAVRSALDRVESDLRLRLASLIPTVQNAALKFEAGLEELVQRQRQLEHERNPEIAPAAPSAAQEDASATPPAEAE